MKTLRTFATIAFLAIMAMAYSGCEQDTSASSERNPTTNNYYGDMHPNCMDKVDNDGDEFVDMLDPGCFVNFNEFDDPQCFDGIDNDGDGLIDYPEDTGCTSPFDNNEQNGQSFACSDGVDNDGDDLIDFPNDPGCEAWNDTSEYNSATTQCSDGIDNDGDDLIDYGYGANNDPDCESAADDNESGGTTTEWPCANGIDDDGDGYIDWPNDSGCPSWDWPTEDNPEVEPACNDGIDNDGDDLIDFGYGANNDPDCTSAADDNEGDPVVIPECMDGIDNDGDGRADYNTDPAYTDPGCSSIYDDNEADDPACFDRLDNDLDGVIDMLDPGCYDIFDTSEGDGNTADLECTKKTTVYYNEGTCPDIVNGYTAYYGAESLFDMESALWWGGYDALTFTVTGNTVAFSIESPNNSYTCGHVAATYGLVTNDVWYDCQPSYVTVESTTDCNSNYWWETTYVPTDFDQGLGWPIQLQSGYDCGWGISGDTTGTVVGDMRLDYDGDGIVDAEDNCINWGNNDQLDTNFDGVGDVCTVGTIPSQRDSDNDRVLDSNDNCVLVQNTTQTDTDGDGVGDACDIP